MRNQPDYRRNGLLLPVISIFMLLPLLIISCNKSRVNTSVLSSGTYIFEREELSAEQFYDKNGPINASENPYDPPTIPPETSDNPDGIPQGGIHFEDHDGGANVEEDSNDIDKIIFTGKNKATFYYNRGLIISDRPFSVKSKGDSVIFEPASNFYTSYIKWVSPLISGSVTTPPKPELTPGSADITNDPAEIKFLSTKRGVKTANGLVLIDYLVTAYNKIDKTQMAFNTLDIDYYKSQLLPEQVFKYVQRKRYFVGE